MVGEMRPDKLVTIYRGDSSDSVSSANGVMAASCCARGTASHLTT